VEQGFVSDLLELHQLLFWNAPSQVMSSLDSESTIRPASASTEKPPNTTEWTAPILAQASMANMISGTRPCRW